MGLPLWRRRLCHVDPFRRSDWRRLANVSKHKTLLTLWSAQTIIVPSWITWSWYTGRWRVRCYIWYSEEGTELGRSPPRPLLAVPTASVPITVLLYIGPLLCGFNVSIKGLTLYRVAPKTASVLWLLISAKRADWYVWFWHTSTAFCFEYSFNLIS